MVRTSPGNKIAILLLIVVWPFVAFAQNSNSSATTQAQVGQRVQLEGVLEVRIEDAKDHGRVFYMLKRQDGTRVPLQFQKNPPRNVSTGDHVKATGQMLGGNLVLYSGSTDFTTTATTSGSSKTNSNTTTSTGPLPYTLGPQSTLLILINFQDNVLSSCDPTAAWNQFSGITNAFFPENSYGQTSFTGKAVGCYTIPESITTCNTSAIATDAQNAATAGGVNLSAYTRYVYLFPLNHACNFAGSSVVGGNPSQTWLNGTMDPHVIDHEMGHAFGLWHSHGLDCGSAASICPNGSVVEYGDQMDVMGTVQTAYPDYNAFAKERLGWLNYGTSPSIQTVTASGTYTITPFENGTGPDALKVLQSTNATTGAKTWYYLESRQAVGSDAFLTTWPYSSTQNETTGVLFHLGTDGDGNSSLMLNMAPATATTNFEMSLAAGQTFQDPATGVTFAVTSANSAGATVQITMNGVSCTAGSPTVSVTPSQSQSVTPGTAVGFTATVTDHDSSGCSAATFNLGDVLPSGWAGTWNTSALSLTPGKSGSATLTVTSPAGTAGGLYTVGVNANNSVAPSDSGSATATYVVTTSGPLSISVGTNQSSYLPGQTVGITVTVLSGSSAAAGVGVTATITSPNGKLTTLKGKTGSTGTALLNYKLSKGAPAGTYQVGATATSSTTSTASATAVANASFAVQ